MIHRNFIGQIPGFWAFCIARKHLSSYFCCGRTTDEKLNISFLSLSPGRWWSSNNRCRHTWSGNDGLPTQVHQIDSTTNDCIHIVAIVTQQVYVDAGWWSRICVLPPAGSPFQGHPAVLSVAPPVIPPPMNMGGPPPPPPPPGPPPPSAGAPQPPLPPPLPMGGGSHGDEPPAQTGLAAMIAGAKLRRVQRVRRQVNLFIQGRP